MNPELKAKWLEALRSGRYKQGQGQLRTDDDRHCCLSVLCDISGKGQWVRQPAKDGDPECWAYSYGDHTSSGVLPYQLEVESGLISEDHITAGTGVLIDMNDAQGASFSQIADYIEANL